jgi:hypothetical protein
MVSLKVLVVFFFAHIINCCFVTWVTKEYYETSLVGLSLKILIAWNAVLFVAYGVVFILLTILNARREASVLHIGDNAVPAIATTVSLDIEEEEEEQKK